MDELTGGWSSNFSPRSGFAFRLAKTPSFADVRWLDIATPGVMFGRPCATGIEPDSCETISLVSSFSILCSTASNDGVERISLCRSSPPFLSSSSDSSPSSKVSASVLSSSEVTGSSEVRKCRDSGDELRE